MEMQYYTFLFFHAFAVTVMIETAVLGAFFFLRMRSRPSRELGIRVFMSGVAASGFTLPFVWFVFPGLIENRMIYLVTAELFAFTAEIPIIRGIIKTTWYEAVATSLLANSISFISGLLLGMS